MVSRRLWPLGPGSVRPLQRWAVGLAGVPVGVCGTHGGPVAWDESVVVVGVIPRCGGVVGWGWRAMVLVTHDCMNPSKVSSSFLPKL